MNCRRLPRSKIRNMRGSNINTTKRALGSNKNYPNAANVVIANTVPTNYAMPQSLLKIKSLNTPSKAPESLNLSKVNISKVLHTMNIDKPKIEAKSHHVVNLNSAEDFNCFKRGSEGSVGDFSDNVYVDGDHINIHNKCSNIHASGEYHTIEKQVKHAYVRGYNNHIKSSVQHINVAGSHVYAVNSGEEVFGTDFEVDGVKKIGKAQSSNLLMTALVNDRGIAFLTNSKADKSFNQYINFPDSNTVVLLSVEYVIVNKDGLYSSGIARNTVHILANGCSEWNKEKFDMVVNSNNFPFNITFSGVNVSKYNNSTSIQVINEQGNADIQVLTKVKMLALQH